MKKFAFLALLLTGCPQFTARLLATVIQCGPALIEEVAEILLSPNWETQLAERSKSYGASSIQCALEALLGRSSPQSSSIATFGPTRNDLVQYRARYWLKGGL